MTRQKKTLSDQALGLVAKRFKALSEPSRLKLLMALQEEAKNVSQLVEETEMTQANVSRQLHTLAEVGILGRERRGLNVYYSIADAGVFKLCDLVCGSLEEHLQDRADAFS